MTHFCPHCGRRLDYSSDHRGETNGNGAGCVVIGFVMLFFVLVKAVNG